MSPCSTIYDIAERSTFYDMVNRSTYYDIAERSTYYDMANRRIVMIWRSVVLSIGARLFLKLFNDQKGFFPSLFFGNLKIVE